MRDPHLPAAPARPVAPLAAAPVVVAPIDAAEVAARLRWARDEGKTMIPVGRVTSGSASTCRAEVVLSLEHLTSPIDHCAGDLTATVAAGASLAEVNAVLQRGGQWLPLDPPAPDRVTIGGLVATNVSGPRRHRYGTPRDLILGVHMVLADGRLAKAGGRVVKNVAGYDLARLLCGSYGSLAVITSATFKLSPLPGASRTVAIAVADTQSLGTIARMIAAAPLTPSAIELESPPHRLLIRFETTPTAADRQAAAVCDLCANHHVSTTILAADAEADAWRQYESRVWHAAGTLVKISVLPTQVPDMLDAVDRLADLHRVEYCAGGRAALGVLYVSLSTHGDQHAAIVTEARRIAVARGGSAVVVSADASVLASVDRWGDMGDAWSLMRAVKMRFDPNGTLNPGGGPGGL